MGLTEQLAEWVINFPPAGSLPETARRRAKLLLLDSIGCAIAAIDTPTGQSTLQTLSKLHDAPTCTILGSSLRCSPANAVLANGVLIRTLDLNDLYIGPQNIGHPSDNLAVVLPIAELCGCTGAEVVSAIVLAYELFLRIKDLGTWVGTAWDPTSASSIAAPAIAGRLLGLGVDQLANAIGLSAAHGSTLSAVRRGELSAGKSVANALVASQSTLITLLAQQGLTGPRIALEGTLGVGQTVFGADDLSSITDPVDETFRITDVSMKAYPSFGVSQAAVAAAIEVHRLIRDSLNDIANVDVRLAETPMTRTTSAARLNARKYPTTRESADHSYYFVVAAALLDGELTLRQFENERWVDPAVRSLIDRMDVRADASLNQYLPGFPCRLSVTLTNGQRHVIEMPYAPGHARSLDATVVESKFHMYAAPLLSTAQREAAIAEIDDLESRSSLDDLLSQVVPTQQDSSV